MCSYVGLALMGGLIAGSVAAGCSLPQLDETESAAAGGHVATAWEPTSAQPMNSRPQIRLVVRTFSAQPGVDGALLQSYATQEAEALHAIIQFIDQPTPAQRREFERKHSIRLLDPIPDHAYLALVPHSALLSEENLLKDSTGKQILIAVVEYLADYKISPKLERTDIGAHAIRGDDRVAITLQFHLDVRRRQRQAVLDKFGLVVDVELPLLNAVQTVVGIAQVSEIAMTDAVKWIIEIPAPAEDDNDRVRGWLGVRSDSVSAPSAFGLSGDGVTIGQWETAVPDPTHEDLKNRIIYVEPGVALDSTHATHVAGTAIGTGAWSNQDGNTGAANQWRGVAPGALMRSYSADNFQVEYQDAVTNNVTISTNSWGTGHCHQTSPDESCYDQNSEFYDAVISGRDVSGAAVAGLKHRVLVIASAGNKGTPDRHADNLIANNRYDAGESIFWDRNDSGILENGIDYVVLPPGLADGTHLIDFRWDERHTEAACVPGHFDSCVRWVGGVLTLVHDNVYRDSDDSGYVSVGDVRLGSGSNLTVVQGDEDIGEFLRPFNLWNNIRIPNGAKDTVMVGAYMLANSLLWSQSGRGPTTDGRVKPDLVAPGTWDGVVGGVKSTKPGNTYRYDSGTSMATPAAAGVAALVSEWYRKACRNDASPLPSTLRAILLHSATDIIEIRNVGSNFVGPDYAHGFGNLGAPDAVSVTPHHIEANISSQTVPLEYEIHIGEVRDLKVMLVWDDPPWSAVAAPSPDTGLLQSDLDLELESPDGEIYTPWLLDPTDPFEPAKQSPGYTSGAVPQKARDRRNTIEQIVVESARPGTWKLRVIASTLNVGPQDFSVVSESLDPQLSPCNAT